MSATPSPVVNEFGNKNSTGYNFICRFSNSIYKYCVIILLIVLALVLVMIIVLNMNFHIFIAQSQEQFVCKFSPQDFTDNFTV